MLILCNLPSTPSDLVLVSVILIIYNDSSLQLTIECPVFAIPAATVKWTLNGRLLQSLQQQSGTDLVLSEDSAKSDSGRYSCAATNPLGRDASWSDVTFIGELTYIWSRLFESGLMLIGDYIFPRSVSSSAH